MGGFGGSFSIKFITNEMEIEKKLLASARVCVKSQHS